MAVDSKRGFVFVACTDHAIVLDPAHDGRVAGSIAIGAGVDNIDYTADAGLLYAAAADAAQLTIARVDDNAKPSPLAVVPTTKGTRSVVAGLAGSAYLMDPVAGRQNGLAPEMQLVLPQAPHSNKTKPRPGGPEVPKKQITKGSAAHQLPADLGSDA